MTFLFVTAGPVATTLLLPNQYEARLKILLKNPRTDAPETDDPISNEIGLTFKNKFAPKQIDYELALLRSQQLLQEVVVECALFRRPSLLERLGLKIAPPKTARIEAATKELAEALSIVPARKNNTIVVKYVSNYPERAAFVLRKLQDLYLEKHEQQHQTAEAWQRSAVEPQLQRTETRASSFQQSLNVVSRTRQKQEAMCKLTESRAKLSETEAFYKQVSERISHVQQQLKAVRLPGMTHGKTRKKVVAEKTTALNPLCQTLETELARARVELAGAQGRRELLMGQVKQLEAQLVRLGEMSTKYDGLPREQAGRIEAFADC